MNWRGGTPWSWEGFGLRYLWASSEDRILPHPLRSCKNLHQSGSTFPICQRERQLCNACGRRARERNLRTSNSGGDVFLCIFFLLATIIFRQASDSLHRNHRRHVAPPRRFCLEHRLNIYSLVQSITGEEDIPVLVPWRSLWDPQNARVRNYEKLGNFARK